MDLVLLGLLVVTVGIAIIWLSAFRSSNSSGDKVRGGGVVLIGPVPVIFGSDAEWASTAILLAILLLVVAWIVFGGLR
ncbi:MAG: DUF131 domain-containing protein [Thaumarchaeota archaeon]|nr:DUF131 domain-containing protein [Nitrososphaerota archaeon]